MQMIWEFPLSGACACQPFVLTMPVGATILSVQLRGDTPIVFAMIYSSENHVARRFVVVAAGMDIDFIRPVKYVGTWQDAAVWHLLELLESPF
jgi:hypothetical protein